MLILASQSPRRREMFDRLQIDYVSENANCDETILEPLAPAEYVKTLALRKAHAVQELHSETDYIIAADTVVALEHTIYGKPVDYDDAFAMISSFSGKSHYVYTGFAILHDGKIYTESVATKVTFRDLSEKEIAYYIEKEKPYDKAGAYGIQEMAGIFVTSVEGNFDNVVGLPMAQLEVALQREFSTSLFDFAR